MSGGWVLILHPHSPSPAVTAQCVPPQGQESQWGKEQEEYQEADSYHKTRLGAANSQKWVTEVRKTDWVGGEVRVGVGRWQQVQGSSPAGCRKVHEASRCQPVGLSKPEGCQGCRGRRREGCHCRHRVGTPAPGLAAEGCTVLAAALRRSRRGEGGGCWCQGHAREREQQISG